MMMTGESRVPEGRVRLKSDHAECSFWFVAPTVLMSRFEGHVDAATAKSVIETLERLTAPLREFHLFNDSEALSSYDPELRVLMTRWVERSRPRLIKNHVLVRSKIVAMGVAVASMLLGDIMRMHSDRRSFESAVGDITARRA